MAGSGGAVGVSDNCGTPCSKSHNLCKIHVMEQCGSGDDVFVCLEPTTPDTTTNLGDSISINVSPLTLPMMEDDVGGRGSLYVDNESPNTPKGSVFNLFADGECVAPQAPYSKILLNEIRGCIDRCLNFGCPVVDIKDGTQATDEDIVDSVYKDLLEVIVLQQAEEILACVSSPGLVLRSSKTPTLLPLLNGIADTCPGAPVKLSTKSRVVYWGLRRKLEF